MVRWPQKIRFLLVFCILSIFLSLPALAGERLRLATTTSTADSGILNEIIIPFEKKTGITVDVIAVGTGKALKLGELGDVDLVLVHSREAENEFVANGYGINRKDVMHNDFIILGPKNDPAEIKKSKNAIKAFKKIANNKITFISRGDESGTHIKEKQLWKKVGIIPAGSWYREVGQGMGSVILMTNDLNAYTLADRGTHIAMKNKVNLVICYEGDKSLYNPYGIIAVNPEKHKNINYRDAKSFINWIISPECQKIIKNFKKSGEQLFYPDTVK